MKKVAVFGGTGFVGERILHELVRRGHQAISFSRKGALYGALNGKSDMKTSAKPMGDVVDEVTWEKADGMIPETYAAKLQNCHSIIISVGSPPLPTFSADQFRKKLLENGDVCAKIIETAESVNINQVVLVNATMPSWAPNGYRIGKQLAKNAAINFEKSRPSNGVVIIYPAGIYGTRYVTFDALNSRLPIPLTLFMKPASLVLQFARRTTITTKLENAFPSVFKGFLDPMVSVSQVATVAADGATKEDFVGVLTEFTNQDVLHYNSMSR